MIIEKLLCCGLAACFAFGAQSLADLASQEAERRKALDEQGVQAKVIEGNPESFAPDGNITTSSTPISGSESKSKSSKSPSLKSYRSTLQKLDRSISRTEERLRLLQSRLSEARWALPKVGRLSRQSGTEGSQERIQSEIDKLEIELKQMRNERAEKYDEGKKAGLLPGELDGKGIIP